MFGWSFFASVSCWCLVLKLACITLPQYLYIATVSMDIACINTLTCVLTVKDPQQGIVCFWNIPKLCYKNGIILEYVCKENHLLSPPSDQFLPPGAAKNMFYILPLYFLLKWWLNYHVLYRTPHTMTNKKTVNLLHNLSVSH